MYLCRSFAPTLEVFSRHNWHHYAILLSGPVLTQWLLHPCSSWQGSLRHFGHATALNSSVIFFLNHWHKLRYSQVIWCLFLTKVHFQVPNLLKTLTLLDLKDQDSTELEVMFSSLCCWWSEQDGQCSIDSWASERATRGAARLDILQI